MGLGWLDGTAATPKPDEVQRVIESTFPGEPVELPGVGWYRNRVAYDDGRAYVAWGGRADAFGTTMVHVEQTALDALGLAGQVELLGALTAAGVRATRLDEWMNDPERLMTPARVREAVLNGQAVTHARPGVFMHDDESGRETYYLGAPSSDRRTRTYDRDDGPCRNELQTRRRAAVHAQAVVLASANPATAILSNIVAFADYRVSKARTTSNARAPRLPWWAALVGDVERAEAAPIRPRPGLDELEVYFREHWGRRLSQLYHAFGPQWLDQLIRDKSRRLEVVA